MATRPLTEARKADRAEMAATVMALAELYGVPASLERNVGTREVAVDITPTDGPYVTVTFDGETKSLDVFVLSWVMPSDLPGKLAPHAFGLVNPHHGRKATDVCEGFNALRTCLDQRFATIACGTATTPNR